MYDSISTDSDNIENINSKSDEGSDDDNKIHGVLSILRRGM